MILQERYGTLDWLYERTERLSRQVQWCYYLQVVVILFAGLTIWDDEKIIVNDLASFLRVPDNLIVYIIPIAASFLFVQAGYLVGEYLDSRVIFLRELSDKYGVADAERDLPFRNLSIAYVMSSVANPSESSWKSALGVERAVGSRTAQFISQGHFSYLLLAAFVFTVSAANQTILIYFWVEISEPLGAPVLVFAVVAAVLAAFYAHFILGTKKYVRRIVTAQLVFFVVCVIPVFAFDPFVLDRCAEESEPAPTAEGDDTCRASEGASETR